MLWTTNNLFSFLRGAYTKKHKAKNALFLHLSLYLKMLIYSFNENAEPLLSIRHNSRHWAVAMNEAIFLVKPTFS